ncbi:MULTISPECIES: threonine ammonia-lyase, biosynthetic [unclassified Variovorax]|jgi:threonine dehydratase|uniref:threonine ammonia-lyase, biosynthetic n=1 Tax=unclassified Variovorax TaxID=663243 RepID=UPI000F7F6C54|nr:MULTISPECIES: threonine ammonia-lyase, biosynthetic [unclassified Variovorax]RSZ44261.1 threonine ammonia-lyase, biosynthetic [Variovorax sp. 553]RSZ45082.1 threonine ammonia-lyase, biosynthetic [Variovorax sp. 679]
MKTPLEKIVRNAPLKPALTPADYLRKILNARVYDVAVESALEKARALSDRLGNTVLLKREDQQPVFSFKLRGAYNKMAHLSPAQLASGVICASAGNHAQGVALGARKLGTRAVIVMPVTTPKLKIDAVRGFGGEIVLHGDSYSDAYLHALELQTQQNLTFVHPFDDPDVIAGQGTIAMEILRQHQGPLDAVFVAIGGGGLISGVANYIKAVRPEVKVIGVQMNDSDAMMQSVAAHQRVNLPDVGLFSDGTAVKLVGEETFRIASDLVDDYIAVDTDAVCAAIKDIFVDTRSIVEPAGALAVAAIKEYVAQHGRHGETYAAILCGANMNFDRLRFVAERAEVGEEREALFAVTIPEERGSFRRFCELIGEMPASDAEAPGTGGGALRNVTEFNYRISDAAKAHVFVGLTTSTRGESAVIARTFNAHGFDALDLTHDELAKEHLRHLVGGRTGLAHDERLLRFVFPERPGALLKFLSLMQPSWNISLFHYRNQGADYGRILVGLQVPAAESAEFDAFLKTLGYPYVEETANPAYRLFLQA